MRKFLIFALLFFAATFCGRGQFSTAGFGNQTSGAQNNQEVFTNDSISATKRFSFKQYFNGLAHKDTISISWMFGGSIILPGTAQIYNKDYWKLPIIYAGIGGLVAGGWYNNVRFQKTDNDAFKRNSIYFFVGAGVMYWASLMDGVICFKSDKNPDPGRATLYSVLFPGLGQAYNGDYWHIPIWYTGLAISGYAWNYNGRQYTRYRDLYNLATTDGGSGYTGKESADNLKYYRDKFRRFRDYSILATALVYLLQVIDANVFATMNDFEISDDLTFEVSPAIITPIGIPDNRYNFATIQNSTTLGVQLQLTF